MAVFLVSAIAGLVDFYRWEYSYGHNLDPGAAIKVPGMTYQPPLIGSTKLLNFTAHSWPGPGGWIAIGVFITAFGLTIAELRAGRRERMRVTPLEPALGKNITKSVTVG
jgi:copper chaperone NosL